MRPAVLESLRHPRRSSDGRLMADEDGPSPPSVGPTLGSLDPEQVDSTYQVWRVVGSTDVGRQRQWSDISRDGSVNVVQEQFRIRGRLLRLGSVESDGFNYLSDVVASVAQARASRSMDIFTFVQTLPHTQREFDFQMELDNFAALPISSYEHWWTSQIDNKTRNMIRKGEK